MPTVWITQNTDLDFSLAHRFGEPQILFGRGVYPDELGERIPKMVDILDRRMSKFVPLVDYILPVGDMFGISLVFYWLGLNKLTPVNILKWDGQHKGYYSIKLTDRELMNVGRKKHG